MIFLVWVHLLYDAHTAASSAVADALNLSRYSLPHCTTHQRVQYVHGTHHTYNYRVTYDLVVEDLLLGELNGLGLGYRFSSLVKQNKKAKICFVITLH
jgi:hypothetical protein